MNTNELIKAILKRLVKFKILIVTAGIVLAILLYFYCKGLRPEYTAKATIFPLTNNTESSLSSNTLSSLLGLGDAQKSFSNDAAINIIELSSSRFVRESVASTRLPEFTNKTIAELLVEDFNKSNSFLEKDIQFSKDSVAAAITGGEILKPFIGAKMSKYGALELYFTHHNKMLITPVATVLIDKISQFYIDLKIKKAKDDYSFTVKKIDSLDAVLGRIDKSAIRMQNTTFFTPERLEYEIPKERINADKQRYVRQRDIALNNQEEALWRLQKLTPVISILDKPTEPFTENKSSAILYAIIGFIAGCVLTALLSVSGLLFRYVKSEIHTMLMEA